VTRGSLRRAVQHWNKYGEAITVASPGSVPLLTPQELDAAVEGFVEAQNSGDGISCKGKALAQFFSQYSKRLTADEKVMSSRSAKRIYHKLRDEGRIARRRSTNVDAIHQRALSNKAYWEWRRGLEEIFKEHPELLSPERIWNVDEAEVSHRSKNRKKSYLVSAVPCRRNAKDRWEQPVGMTHADKSLGHITLVAGGNANGDRVPSAYVFKQTPPLHLRDPYETSAGYKFFPFKLSQAHMNEIFTGSSDSGYMTQELWEEYLTGVVVPAMRAVVPEGPVLLTFDGASVHSINLEALEKIVGQDVILYTFPHNTTLVLQPCDNGLFADYKNNCNNLLQIATSVAFSPDRYVTDNGEIRRLPPGDQQSIFERTQGIFRGANVQLDLRPLIWLSEAAL